jgi:hypothetical protein
MLHNKLLKVNCFSFELDSVWLVNPKNDNVPAMDGGLLGHFSLFKG